MCAYLYVFVSGSMHVWECVFLSVSECVYVCVVLSGGVCFCQGVCESVCLQGEEHKASRGQWKALKAYESK